MITVDEIMSASLYTLTESHSIYDAKQLMSEKGVRHIPIISGEDLVGLVSQRDVLAAAPSTLLKLTPEESEALEKAHALSEIMTRKLCTIDARESLKSAALHLRKHKHGCLPVLCKGKLKGIITDTDFVGIAVHLIEQMEEMENGARTDDLYDEDRLQLEEDFG